MHYTLSYKPGHRLFERDDSECSLVSTSHPEVDELVEKEFESVEDHWVSCWSHDEAIVEVIGKAGKLDKLKLIDAQPEDEDEGEVANG